LNLAKLEDGGIFQKKLSLLGEEEAESSQIDLLLIRFHLGKVGVHRQVQRQSRSDSILDVHSHFRHEIHVVSLSTRQGSR
jgi:hypothetical protein